MLDRDAAVMDTVVAAAACDGGVLGRKVVEGETVGADGARGKKVETFRAEEDDAPEGAEGTDWRALGTRRRRREANAAAVAAVQVGLAARGRRGRGRQGRAGGRGATPRAMLREETRRRRGVVAVGGGGWGGGCGLHHWAT